MLSSYPSIYTLGHKYLADLFSGPVVIQEKIDGSQFSFGTIDGKLHCRSKGQEINIEAPEKMFSAAVDTAKRLFDESLLYDKWIYRCEYLSKPKHNTLEYSRIPAGNLVLFDVQLPGENYFPPFRVRREAELLELEPVPVLFEGVVDPEPSTVQDFLDRESCLGGCKIEEIVVKNYNEFGVDKKILVGKFVSQAFKEVHRYEWRKANPTQSDIVQQIIADYKTSPRWQKAIQHLRERGTLAGTPADIGPLIQEIQRDVNTEEGKAIAIRLLDHFWPQIARGITSGFPEWYKVKLAGIEEI